jgi:ribosomal protein S18 acetylase RimI-like enzyme
LPGTNTPKGSSAASEISLRQARSDDYDFAAELYLGSTRPLLMALGLWHEGRIVARFRQAFKIEQIQVIRLDGADIGWMQVSESPERLHLHQLHIVPEFHNQGIGTRLIGTILDRARKKGRPALLNVIRGNRALSLYRRLGFRVVGGDAEKLHMRWDADWPHRH